MLGLRAHDVAGRLDGIIFQKLNLSGASGEIRHRADDAVVGNLDADTVFRGEVKHGRSKAIKDVES